MDCQNYTYARLDSLDPEAYKRGENISDVKISTEGEQALLEQRYATKIKTIKEIKKSKRVLSTLDIFISIFVVTPCTVGCWRGLWHVMDVYAYYFPEWESIAIGMAAHIILALGQDVFHYVIVEKGEKNPTMRIFSLFVMKFYTITFCVITIMTWRGGWILFDRYCQIKHSSRGTPLLEGSSTANWFTLVCIIMLLCLKVFRNTLAPPFSIALDLKDEVFLFSTRYIYKIGEKTSLYILDCLFSVLIVGTLVVFVWRGAWVLMEILLFPNNEILSAWGSLIIGYVSVAVAFLLQPVMRYLCDRFSGTPRLLIADFFILFAFFGTVNVWRGIWNLLNLYFLPDQQELSCWITHWVCLIALILLGCSNSLLVRGVYIDAEEPAGKCVVFPCYYLRIIFQGEKRRELNLTSLNFEQQVKVHKKDSEKIAENNHVVSVSTVSSTIEENHKENFQ